MGVFSSVADYEYRIRFWIWLIVGLKLKILSVEWKNLTRSKNWNKISKQNLNIGIFTSLILNTEPDFGSGPISGLKIQIQLVNG